MVLAAEALVLKAGKAGYVQKKLSMKLLQYILNIDDSRLLEKITRVFCSSIVPGAQLLELVLIMKIVCRFATISQRVPLFFPEDNSRLIAAFVLP